MLNFPSRTFQSVRLGQGQLSVQKIGIFWIQLNIKNINIYIYFIYSMSRCENLVEMSKQ